MSSYCTLAKVPRIFLAVLLGIAVAMPAGAVGGAPPVTVDAFEPVSVTWTTAGDFSANAATTGKTTTRRNLTTSEVPGAALVGGDIVAVAASSVHTVALRADGTCVAIGENGWGRCEVSGWTDIVAIATAPGFTIGVRSDGTCVSTGPTDFSGWTGIVSVAAAFGHIVGVKSDGTCVAMGTNDQGQCDVGAWTGIVAVDVGSAHSVGLKADGTCVATGSNSDGQCDVGSWTDIVAVDVGSSHSVGLKADGTCVATGSNGDGQCDVGSWTDIVAVAANHYHTVGVRSDGTCVAAGNNDYGQRDLSGWTDIVDVEAGTMSTVGIRADGTCVAVGDDAWGQCGVWSWNNPRTVDAAMLHTVGVEPDRTAVAVGSNTFGQRNVFAWAGLADIRTGGSTTVGLLPDGRCVATGDDSQGQASLAGWGDMVQVYVGGMHTVGLQSDGTCVATGWNAQGQCNTSAWDGIVAIAAGGMHTVGLRSDGTCVATGNNTMGECNVSEWTDIVAVEADGNHTVGLRSDGTCVATGWNDYGQCDVSEWTDIVAIGAGSVHSIGLRSGGTCVAAGLNADGQCDVSDWSDIVAVAGGFYHTVGLQADGTCVATGSNTQGQCNVGTWELHSGSLCPGWIGGEDEAVGLRIDTGFEGGAKWDALTASFPALATGQSVQFAVRTSDDGVTFSEPLGADGKPINWLPHGLGGNYLGQDWIDDEPHVDLSAIPATRYLDIVVRINTQDSLVSPWLRDVTLSYAEADPLEGQTGLIRVAGTDRYKTAVEASVRAYPDGADTVVIATGANWPDALGGSALAGAVRGPLLLTQPTSLPAAVTAEIQRLGAESAYILGGTGAVSGEVETSLKSLLGPEDVVRLAGADRYTTAAEVAAEVIELLGDGYDGEAFVATGGNFPDALAGSPLAAAKGWPILLAHPSTGALFVPSEVKSAAILGGTGAVSAAVETALESDLGADKVARYGGLNRYATAKLVAEFGIAEGLRWNGLGIATGENFPDALSGGAMLGAFDSVMLLTPSASLHADASSAMTANKASIKTAFIIGGTGAVSAAVEASAKTALGQ